MMPEPAQEWFSVAECCGLLKRSDRTIRKRIAAGQIPAEKHALPGGGVEWRVPAAWVESEAERNRDGTRNGNRDGSAPEVSTLESVGAQIGMESGTESSGARNGRRDGTETEGEGELLAALLAEKDARIRDLQAQLEEVNGALEREQTGHAETRRLLAHSMPAAPMLQAPQQAARVPVEQKDGSNAKGAQRGSNAPHTGLWRRVRWILQGKA